MHAKVLIYFRQALAGKNIRIYLSVGILKIFGMHRGNHVLLCFDWKLTTIVLANTPHRIGLASTNQPSARIMVS